MLIYSSSYELQHEDTRKISQRVINVTIKPQAADTFNITVAHLSSGDSGHDERMSELKTVIKLTDEVFASNKFDYSNNTKILMGDFNEELQSSNLQE